MYYDKCKHSLAVVHLTINIFVSNYQNLLVIFTAALSPTISSTHMTLLLHIKDSMG